MSTFRKVDPSTLGWVKNEIDESLKQARLALEEFVENPSDRTRLRFCITHLHQVVGTLLMVELDGAAFMAREVEALAEAVLDEKVEVTNEVLDVLTRGILILPDYLARLQFGHADVPLKHLPLINEMRARRKAEPLAEFELFQPDLSVRPPAPGGPRERLSDAEYAALARKLRSTYQAALLDFLREPDGKEPLRTIAGVIAELQAKANLGLVEQLFWVAGGLLEGMIDGALPVTPERKKHLARIDQQVKKVVDGAERSLLRGTSEALVRALLYEIAQAGPGGPQVEQLKRAFALDSLLAPAEDERLDLPSPEVLESVAKVLGKEIEQAQDRLAAAFDSRRTDEAALAPLLDLLHKMAGTLEMLGVPLLKDLLEELSAACRALAGGRIEEPERAAMPMAQALLLVENSARDMHRSAADWRKQIDQAMQALRALHAPDAVPSSDGIEVSDAELTETEFNQLLSVVGNEVGVNLGRIEEALESFAAATTQLERLDEIPRQLGQIEGALQILGLERAVELARVTRGHVETMRRGEMRVDPALLDAFAVCIGSIGAYLEGLRAGRRNIDGLIESALGEIATAVEGRSRPASAASPPPADPRAALKEWLDRPGEAASRKALEGALAGLSRSRADGEKAARIAAEMSRLIAIVSEDPDQLSDEVRATLLASFETLSREAPAGRTERPANVAPAPAAATAKTAPPAGEDDDFDDEIMQIFIEDARDVLGNVTREYARWSQDHGNQGALAELRRGFHTLKGSGRMVGASEVAELAWAIENMLNHLRDGKITVSPAVIDVLERAQAVLPEMVAQLEGGPAPAVDIEALRGEAHALVGGTPPAPAAKAKATAAAKSPDAGQTDALPKLDGTLLEIFTNEARGHLATIRKETAACRQAGACLVSPALTRSIHTLQGNARSLGIRMMAEACAETEKLFHVMSAESVPLAGAHLDMLDRFADVVAELVAALNDSGAGDHLAGRFAEITQTARREHDAFVALERPRPSEPDSSIPVDAEEIELIAPSGADEPPPEPAPSPDPVATAADTAAPQERHPAPSRPRSTPAAPSAEGARAAVADQIDPELFEIFREEATDILAAVEQALRAWRAAPEDTGVVLDLKRALHTLKGGARMAGVMSMGQVSHTTETLLQHVENRAVPASAELFDLLEETHDVLVAMLDRIAGGEPAVGTDSLDARLAAFASGRPPAAVTAPVAPPEAPRDRAEPAGSPSGAPGFVPEAQRASDEPDTEAHIDRREAEASPDAWPDRRERRGQIRVNTDLLNNLVNYAGEVSIARARMEQQIYGFRDNLSELSSNVSRFREQLRELEIQSESQILYRLEQQDEGAPDFDPLEFDRFSRLQQLSRQLTESLHDLTTIQMNMGNFVGEAETVLAMQARINTELQEGLMRTRMVEFSTQAGRLRHIVRQTARELGKRAELVFAGSDVQIDRTVLERMIGPFEHMIRNSLDHGIEPEGERVRKGKPAGGTITIATAQEGSEVVIRFSDDGAGMDTARIRAKAIERGLMSADASLSDDEILQFILISGFSTAEKITHVSGRGVGMDVVHNEVKQLGGSMSVETERGQGTTFTIRLPLTLSIAQALMVYVGDQQFAVPLSSVVNIIEYPLDQLHRLSVGKNPLLNHNDEVYPFMNLGARLGIPAGEPTGRKVPILLARAANREVAIQVDGLGGTREIVIKQLGPQLTEIKGLAGATILGDGRVVLILDVPGLWYSDDTLHVEHRAERPQVEEEVRERPVVMVVDDSLTVRKVTGKHLQKRGFDVMVAKDGVDAVEQLRDRVPDIMLVDIEMPRMDGYELTSRIRAESRLKHVPIIMITSRAGAKHRNRAFELGVDEYMSKPYQEDELFRNIDTLLARGRGR
ncbi:chemotaxis protein CheA [Sulfurifustis variabilis]|uniref:Chemotaxis protein CheA n=1 Tax=Sulfurifustis variabilis TaxID=1675686 RepID=A0A1C7AFE6_9GAMM|nr:Hpt domain-containing protein [Sulfurifustis variabilis]BAU50028.1 chemotaxis protein CheA [Sulfurifustis variabilis]